MDPTLNGALFYLETMALVAGLLTFAMALVIGKGPVRYAMKRWEPETPPGPRYRLRKALRWVRVNQTTIGAFLLFFFGAAFNFLLGLHAALGVAAIHAGELDWYFHALRFLQVIGVWMFIRGLLTPRKYKNPPQILHKKKHRGSIDP
jgi:hypothetical protein